MSEYYYDEERAVAYKISPPTASPVPDEATGALKAFLVHTNVKLTNFKKEKVRRTISQVYPSTHYDENAALREFRENVLARLLGGAKEITREEYERIKERVEVSAG